MAKAADVERMCEKIFKDESELTRSKLVVSRGFKCEDENQLGELEEVNLVSNVGLC